MSESARIVDKEELSPSGFDEPTENDKELIQFVVDHTDRWREYRDQNFIDDWDKYERIFRGKWDSRDKTRDSERSRVISPATQQAIETRHAEVMEAIFGQGEYFDIKDDIKDIDGSAIDVEQLKAQLMEDFSKDKIRKAIDQIELMAEIYGTGIGEIIVGKEKCYRPASKQVPALPQGQQVPVEQPQGMPQQQGAIPTQLTQTQPQQQIAYGVEEYDRFFVKINPVNPKNFIFDPNGVSIEDCMGVAIERNVSIHKIAAGISSGKYRKVDISASYIDDSLEPTQEESNFQDDKVQTLTYYGLVPKEYLKKLQDEDVVELFSEDIEDYTDMVEAIIVIANGSLLLKAEESPYMMKDRPVISYQDDTVPNRLLGRGTAEKAYNMQVSIDGSIRSHMDALALTNAPMVALDATRLPRGAKFEVKPGKAFMTNGNPSEIMFPFKFGTNDGAAMNTSKEFERMLLMATGTLDSNGQITQGSRDAGGLAPAVAGIIKKYKRTLVNFQEDFLIPFVNKAAWRYMQFDPERYPSVDVKFIPTATLGIIAREYEQQQLAFLMQTLGADSPLTPILMQGILHSSSLSNREQLIEQMKQAMQPDPTNQKMELMKKDMELKFIDSQTSENNAQANYNNAMAQLNQVKAMLHPKEVEAQTMAAMTKNLPTDADVAQQAFDQRLKVSELLLKEEEVNAKKAIVEMQMQDKKDKQTSDSAYLDKVTSYINQGT